MLYTVRGPCVCVCYCTGGTHYISTCGVCMLYGALTLERSQGQVSRLDEGRPGHVVANASTNSLHQRDFSVVTV